MDWKCYCYPSTEVISFKACKKRDYEKPGSWWLETGSGYVNYCWQGEEEEAQKKII